MNRFHKYTINPWINFTDDSVRINFDNCRGFITRALGVNRRVKKTPYARNKKNLPDE
jgi:hypothetical protein